jgi:hypothetical protein
LCFMVFLLVDLRAEDSSSRWPGYRGKGQASLASDAA